MTMTVSQNPMRCTGVQKDRNVKVSLVFERLDEVAETRSCAAMVDSNKRTTLLNPSYLIASAENS